MADINALPRYLEPMYSSSRFTLENLLLLSDVEKSRITLKLMSARYRQMAASVFYEPNQLKPRACSYNRPLHVLLSNDESTKLALEQVNKYLYLLRGTKCVHFLHSSFSFSLISLFYRQARIHLYVCMSYLNLLATDFFFQILAHPVFKMWVIQKPNKVALWNKRHFEGKNGDYTACLKYSVRIFVE